MLFEIANWDLNQADPAPSAANFCSPSVSAISQNIAIVNQGVAVNARLNFRFALASLHRVCV
jgi:hypothetical protein